MTHKHRALCCLSFMKYGVHTCEEKPESGSVEVDWPDPEEPAE